MKNHYNQTSVLTLDFQYQRGKTVLKDYYFTAPFKTLPPFEMENGFTRAMVMSSSGGILAGDVQEITLHVGSGCKSQLISQSYEKIHKMEEGHGTRRTTIHVDSNGTLHFLPLPTIPFAGSAFETTTEINLEDNSAKLLYSEVVSAGRVHFGESFQYRFYKTLTNIRQNGQLIYRDYGNFTPEHMDLDGYLLFEGHTHLLSQVICGYNISVKALRQFVEDLHLDLSVGITQLEQGSIALRALGHSGNTMEQLAEQVSNWLIATCPST